MMVGVVVCGGDDVMVGGQVVGRGGWLGVWVVCVLCACCV